MFISLKDCLEEKILLERKLAVALGLLATCKLDLETCRGEEEGQRGWLELALIISAARLVILFLNHPCPSIPLKVMYPVITIFPFACSYFFWSVAVALGRAAWMLRHPEVVFPMDR